MDDMAWRITRIVENVSIYEFFTWIKEPVTPSDHPHQIHCPFYLDHAHADLNRSARIFPEDDRIYCFTESKSRDILDCVRDHFGLSLPQAIRFIEQKLNLKPDLTRKLKQQLSSALHPKPKSTRKAPLHLPEQNILNLTRNLRKLTDIPGSQILQDMLDFIWAEYDLYYLHQASLKSQIQWELQSKSLLRYALRNMRTLKTYTPT